MKFRIFGVFVCLFFVASASLQANEPGNNHRQKVVGGYFEEWSIYGANFNVANLQTNGVASKLGTANVSRRTSLSRILRRCPKTSSRSR